MFVFIIQGRLLIVSVMVHTTIRTSVLGLSPLASNCPTNCSCISTTVTCNGTIPDVVPDNTEEVVLINLDWLLAPRRFCNVTWKNVKNMGILYDYYVTLSDHVFDCLVKNRKYGNKRNLGVAYQSNILWPEKADRT